MGRISKLFGHQQAPQRSFFYPHQRFISATIAAQIGTRVHAPRAQSQSRQTMIQPWYCLPSPQYKQTKKDRTRASRLPSIQSRQSQLASNQRAEAQRGTFQAPGPGQLVPAPLRTANDSHTDRAGPVVGSQSAHTTTGQPNTLPTSHQEPVECLRGLVVVGFLEVGAFYFSILGGTVAPVESPPSQNSRWRLVVLD